VQLLAEVFGDGLDVFVAAAGQVDDDEFGEFAFHLEDLCDGVGAFEGGDDAFGSGEQREGDESLIVGDTGVCDSFGVFPVGVLGADAGVVEPGRAGVDRGGLAIGVLQDVAEAAVEDAGVAEGERGGVVAVIG